MHFSNERAELQLMIRFEVQVNRLHCCRAVCRNQAFDTICFFLHESFLWTFSMYPQGSFTRSIYFWDLFSAFCSFGLTLLWEIKTDLALFCLSDVRVSWSITLCNWFKWSWFSFDWQDKTLIKMSEKKSKGVMGYVLQKVARLKIKNRKNWICTNRLALYLKYYNTNITMCIMSS